MRLEPTGSPWVDVLAVVGVCIWITAIGAPIARAVFGRQPRWVWPYYAPVVGLVAVLLVTNLAAYAIPGAPAAWFGLLAPTAASVVIAWRSGRARPSRQSVASLLALGIVSAGAFVFALAYRTHVWFVDEGWHFPLALRLARGVFPPVTPYGPDAGIGYHYGPDLLVATTISTTGAPPWTAFYVFASFLVVALVLAATGFARHLGTPLLLAVGIGAALALFSERFLIGLPPYVEPPAQASGFAAFLAGLAPAETAHPDSVPAVFLWVDLPQRTLAVAVVILVAAALESRMGHRQAAVLAAGAGVLALAESSVMIFASAALALVGALRFVWLRGQARLVLVGAMAVSALLIAFAGGAVSDWLFGRGGTTGLVRVAFDPNHADLAPFELAGPALVGVGILPLAAASLLVAVRQRSWGLGYLVTAGALGLVQAESLHSALPQNDGRVLWLATAVALLAALSGVGALVGRMHGWRRAGAMLAVGLFVILPLGLPRAISGAQLAASGLELGFPTTRSNYTYLNRTQFGEELAANWDFYAWLAQSLPNDARLLTTHPSIAASTAGVAAPVSGRDVQRLSSIITPVYEDALRFLHHADLAEMGVTHLHLTDAFEAALAPSARRLLDDPEHFRLLADRRSSSGLRHRVFEVQPGAGTVHVAPSSYRHLRELAPPNVPISLAGSLSLYQRRMVFHALIDHDDLRTPERTEFDRATRVPHVETVTDVPDRGIGVLPDFLEPTAGLGQSRGDAIWTGYGMRAYDLSTSAWSPVWRISQNPAGLPDDSRHACESAAHQQFELRVLGEPGTTMTVGLTDVELTGVPQDVQLSVPDCDALALVAHAGVAPFAQIRPHHPAARVERESNVAGLGFDGGVDGGRAIVNLWYRNPLGLPFITGTELRLYEARPGGMTPREYHPENSLRWWSGPLVLAPDAQLARIEFDARRLEIDGTAGGATPARLVPGTAYLLALTVAGKDPRSGYAEVQHVVPLARVVLHDEGVTYDVFGGIVAVEPHEPGTIVRNASRTGFLGLELDQTPR